MFLFSYCSRDALEKYHPDCKEPVVVLVTVRKDTNSVYQQIMQKMENGGNQRYIFLMKYFTYKDIIKPITLTITQHKNDIFYLENI